MATWTDTEVLKLIDLWKEEGIQEQLEGSTRNRHVYEKLATQLTKAGFQKTGEQCRCKVKKLRQEYKKVKDNNGLTGKGRMIWKYYDAMNEVLGNRPATRPPVVIDTTASTSTSADNSPDHVTTELEDEETGDFNVHVVESGEDSSSELSGTGAVADKSLSGSSMPTDSEEGKDLKSNSTEIQKRKGWKRARSKIEAFEGTMAKIVKTISDGLKEGDRMYMEFEEKRRESEIQQRREEREFQLKLAQLLGGHSTPPSYYSNYPSQLYGSPHPASSGSPHPASYYHQGSGGNAEN